MTGSVALGQGQRGFFDIVGSAQAFPTPDADSYEVQLSLSASGEFPDGFVFGHGEVRSTNGDVCGFDISSSSVADPCPEMFSSDGGFTISVEAFSGALPS